MSAPGGLRRLYGESPWQLTLLAASFAVTGYAGVRLLDGDTLGVLIWFVGAALLHDMVLLPLYSQADRLPRLAGRYVNHVRVPAALSLLLLLVWFPLISGPPERYEPLTGRPGGGYAARWLLVTAALFVLSGLLLVARRARTHRAGRGSRTGRTAAGAPTQECGEAGSFGESGESGASGDSGERRSATNERPPDSH